MIRGFLDAHRRLRNGWWMLIFVALIALTRVVYRPLKAGLIAVGGEGAWLEPLPVVLVLLVTWACTRLRREPLSSVGLRLDRRWAGELGVGTALGMGTLGLAVAMIWSTGGLHLELDPARSMSALAVGAFVWLMAALLEEILFRGFLFQRLVAGIGAAWASFLVAGLFALGHWGNPGMEGATMAWASVELALAALLLGLAYLRTGSLALPIGIHFGWNWAQGEVLGFGVSGHAQAGWWRPVFHGQPEWLTGGGFGPEASVFAVVVDLLLLAALWRWRGSRSAPAPAIDGLPPVPAVAARARLAGEPS